MKLNKKGITLIEIIISIVLISIVLIFLFTMLIAVNDMNSESEMDSTYLINKSLFIKNVDEDLKYADPNESVNISSCVLKDESDFFPAYDDVYLSGLAQNQRASECIKLEYTDVDGGTTRAYIGIFYLNTQESYVISYVNGSSKSTRMLPKFEDNNVSGSTINNNIKINPGDATSTTAGFVSIEIPIIGPDGKDYTIMIPYYGKVDTDL